MKRYFLLLLVSVVLFAPGISFAQTADRVASSTAPNTISEAQINAILELLRSFGADQWTIDSVEEALWGAGIVKGASTGFKFTHILRQGSSGPDVTELQKRLTSERVYTGSASGYFGALTKAAVVRYQEKYALEPVGVVGPKTQAELNK